MNLRFKSTLQNVLQPSYANCSNLLIYECPPWKLSRLLIAPLLSSNPLPWTSRLCMVWFSLPLQCHLTSLYPSLPTLFMLLLAHVTFLSTILSPGPAQLSKKKSKSMKSSGIYRGLMVPEVRNAEMKLAARAMELAFWWWSRSWRPVEWARLGTLWNVRWVPYVDSLW